MLRFFLFVVLCVAIAVVTSANVDLSFTQSDYNEITQAVNKLVHAHRKYVSDLENHELGKAVVDLAHRTGSDLPGEATQELETTFDIDKESVNAGEISNVRVGVNAATGLGKLIESRSIDNNNNNNNNNQQQQADSVVSFVEEQEGSGKWWKKRPPKGSPKIKYNKSQGFWRCTCGARSWGCEQKAVCVSPEITEEDILKEEAQLAEIEKKTGHKPKSKYEGLKYHPGAFDCTMEMIWDCSWKRPCECLLPWKNVPECRPLKRITPPRCPVKCDKKAWPWNWLCTRYCWCPGCSAPFCAWHLWFTLVCRKHCTCEAKCPDSPISAEP